MDVHSTVYRWMSRWGRPRIHVRVIYSNIRSCARGKVVPKSQAAGESRRCIDARRSGLREMTQSPSHYNIVRSPSASSAPPALPPPSRSVSVSLSLHLSLLTLVTPFSPRATHSAAQLRSPTPALPSAGAGPPPRARLVPRSAPTSSMPRSKRPRLATVSVVSVRDTRSFSRRRSDESGSRARPRSVCVRCPSFRVRVRFSRLFLDDSESKTRRASAFRIPLSFPPTVPAPAAVAAAAAATAHVDAMCPAMSMCWFRFALRPSARRRVSQVRATFECA